MVAELAADDLSQHREVDPTLAPVGILDAESLHTLEKFAEAAILENATPGRGRKKENVSDDAMHYIREMPILKWCTGLASSVGELWGATFLHYDGGDMKIHLDNDGAYDFTLLACLNRVIPEGKKGSTTYFMLGNGVTRSHSLMPGDSVFFHSRYTPHGRTPLVEGERVVLLHLQFKGGGPEFSPNLSD